MNMSQNKAPFVLALEGPDRCGKTQIATALSVALRIPTFKATTEHETFLSKQDLFVQQLRFALPREIDLIAQGCIPYIIYDRSWGSEFAYSAYYGRLTDNKVLRYVDNRMAEFGAKIVICYRSSYEGIVDDIQPMLQGQGLAQIEQKYREFAQWTKCDTLFLNVDDEDLARECTEILSWLGYRDRVLDEMIETVREHDAYVRSGAQACCV